MDLIGKTGMPGYTDIEIDKLNRIADWMESPTDPDELERTRRNFYNFFNAHDKRRDTNFKKTFPEFASFYDECKEIAAKA